MANTRSGKLYRMAIFLAKKSLSALPTKTDKDGYMELRLPTVNSVRMPLAACIPSVICMVLTACSGSHGGPSGARMASLIAGRYNQEFEYGYGDKLVQVKDLKQSQGRLTATGRYMVFVHFDMKFTKSLAEMREQDGDTHARDLHILLGDFRAGDTRPMSDAAMFQKTGKGWKLIELYALKK